MSHLCFAVGSDRLFAPRFRAILIAALVMGSGLLTAGPALSGPASLPGTDALERLRGLELEKAFDRIATGIRYEPYRGILRGAQGTALSRSGNAADQALLLADILRAQGYRVRFVRGQLARPNLQTLLRGLYPPELPTFALPSELDPFVLDQDARLKAVAADHVWLEVDQGNGTWLPLDPAFPRAKIGEAYAKAQERLDELPEPLHQRLRLVLREQTAKGETRELGRFEGRVSDLAQATVSLAVQGARQLPAGKDEQASGNAAMGAFGSTLAGREPQPTTKKSAAPPAAVGTRYRRILQVGDETKVWQSSLVLDAKPETRLQREWLEITVQVPGEPARIVERDLFVADAPGVVQGQPADYRRYTLAILPGPVPVPEVQSFAKRVDAALNLRQARTQIDGFSDESKAEEHAQQAATIETRTAPLIGHLMALRFAAESDTLSSRVALNNGVVIAHTIPRVLIVSVEGDPQTRAYRTALDLRLDEIEAWPFPGNAARAANNFQEARGVQNTLLEGRVLERMTGDEQPAANTGHVMAQLSGGMSGLLAFRAGQEDRLSEVAQLSPYARRLIEASLKRGRVVAIPSQPVQLAGRARYGWWEIDPASGRTIGVMDDGLHQAMVDHSLASTEIGLNDHTALTLGMIVGGVVTHFRLAAGILEYGEVTEELIKEIEQTIKDLKCFSCPQVELKLHLKPQIGDSCWYKSYGAGYTHSGLKFCQSYTDGMGCSAAMIINGLRGKSTKPGVSAPVLLDKKLICEL